MFGYHIYLLYLVYMAGILVYSGHGAKCYGKLGHLFHNVMLNDSFVILLSSFLLVIYVVWTLLWRAWVFIEGFLCFVM